ncbi:unnamed protein product, partial [Adineta steineri]
KLILTLFILSHQIINPMIVDPTNNSNSIRIPFVPASGV